MQTILHFDTETSGFLNPSLSLHHPDQARVVQIGAILDEVNDDGVIRELMRLDIIINVPNIPDKVAAIHGITTEMSQRLGVNEGTAMDLFCDMVDVADLIVGQNVEKFDCNMIRSVVRRLNNSEDLDPFAGKELFDTMLVGKPICAIRGKAGGYKNPTLTELHTFLFGEGFDKAHSAINDVLATRRCFYELRNRLDIEKVGRYGSKP